MMPTQLWMNWIICVITALVVSLSAFAIYVIWRLDRVDLNIERLNQMCSVLDTRLLLKEEKCKKKLKRKRRRK
jgi:hypothetical protein